MYVPLGGNRRRALNAWLIFTFVALWHDVEWRLLVWAWLMSLLFTPELVRRCGQCQGPERRLPVGAMSSAAHCRVSSEPVKLTHLRRCCS